MKATIWSEEFRKLCEPKSDEQFEKIVRHVDAYASEYLAQNNSYLSGRVDTLYKDLEIAKAENAGLKAAIRAQPEATALTDDFAKIREVLSWHDHERDDLTLDDVIDVIRHGYVKVRGRTDRAMFLQIAALLSAPAQAAVEPNDDTATLWARIHHLEAELKGPDDFATWKDAAVAERLRRVKAERKATDDALAIRDAALEDAAIMLENGIFLHDDSPAKRLAKEAAAAIRRMKSQVQKPLSKAERIAELQAELTAHLAEDDGPQPAQDAVERDHWKPNDAQAAIIRDIAMEEIAYRPQPVQGIAQPVAEVDERELPPLPEPTAEARWWEQNGFNAEQLQILRRNPESEKYWGNRDKLAFYTTSQMRAYARAALAQSPARQEQLNGGRPLPFDREELGRMVRQAWVKWAQAQPSKKPSWLVPYDQLSESDKEADRQIGEFVARWTLIADAVRHCDARNSAQPQPGEKA